MTRKKGVALIICLTLIISMALPGTLAFSGDPSAANENLTLAEDPPVPTPENSVEEKGCTCDPKPAEGEPLVNSQMGMYELLRNDWQRTEPWKCTTPAPEAEKPAAVCQEVTVEQLKQELPHVFQPAPEKAEKAAPAAQQPDHYEALEQMLNNKPRAAQPAPKAPAAPRPAVKPVVTAPKKKSLLERIGSFFRR